MADPAMMDLSSVCGGGVVAQVDEALRECVKSILDPNTDATAKREVLIRLVLKPEKDRYRVDLRAFVSHKLPGRAALPSLAFVSRRGVGLIEHQSPEQQVLDVVSRFPVPATGDTGKG